jgi:hypothetical protein
MNKGNRLIVFVFLVLFFLSLFVGFVSAGPMDDISRVVRDLGSAVGEVLRPALGDSGLNEEDFFSKVLLAVVVFSVVYLVLSQIKFFGADEPGKGWIIWIVTIAVTLLGVRFLDGEYIRALILNYQVLGVAILAGIPFIVWFLFVEKAIDSSWVRKFLWFCFALAYLFLWFSYYDLFDPSQGLAKWIFPLACVMSLLMAVFDGTIERYKKKIGHERNMSVAEAMQYDRLLKERKQVQEAMHNFISIGDTMRAQSLRTRLEAIDQAITVLLH